MIKIGIVDDHAIVRSGLRQFFSDQVDLRVVGEAGSGREAIDLVRKAELDVLLMDLSMPGPVSYTPLTLPTILRLYISVSARSLEQT